MSTKRKLVNCPHCGAPAPYVADNLFRPFCSERCKMIDLGRWAAEGYRIPQAENPDPQGPGEQEN